MYKYYYTLYVGHIIYAEGFLTQGMYEMRNTTGVTAIIEHWYARHTSIIIRTQNIQFLIKYYLSTLDVTRR